MSFGGNSYGGKAAKFNMGGNMSIITISRGSLKKGNEVAAKAGAMAGYGLLDREILIEASEQFNIPKYQLTQALDVEPDFLDRFSFSKRNYVAYIRTALLERLACDNMLYHGFAGQMFLTDVSHVLKVRIVGSLQNRIQDVMAEDQIDEELAAAKIQRIDDTRRKWGRYFYEVDIEDPTLYDLVINVDNMTVENAADLILSTVQLPCFQTTEQSRIKFQDLLLAAKANSALLADFPAASVTSKDGVVSVAIEGTLLQESSYQNRVNDALEGIVGIENVKTEIWPILEPH